MAPALAKEIQLAWKSIQDRKDDVMLKEIKEKKEQDEIKEYVAKVQEWNADIENPSHNEFYSKGFKIVSNLMIDSQVEGEPPAKNTPNMEEASSEEAEGKNKEVAEAAKESAKFEADKAAAVAAEKAAEQKKKAEIEAAEAARKKAAAERAAADDWAAKRMPDGLHHQDGKRYFPDGKIVSGINDYAQLN